MKPQCSPKITRICHVRPTMAPAIIGLKSRIEITKSAMMLELNVATGPITRNPIGSVTNSVSIGTKKNFTRSGMNLLKSFSHFEAKYTTNITGMTVPV